MQPPMMGSWTVEVKAVRPFTIHGDLYYELDVVRVDEGVESGFRLRVPEHATNSPPVEGVWVVIEFLMGQVMSVKVV